MGLAGSPASLILEVRCVPRVAGERLGIAGVLVVVKTIRPDEARCGMAVDDNIPKRDPHEAETPSDDRRFAHSRVMLLIVLGLLLAIAVGGFSLMRRGSLQSVTRESFDAARQRWRQAGLSNYNMEIKVNGRQPATYYVEVRDGETTAAHRNGQPLKRTPSTWTVPGMFYTLSQDVQNVEKVAAGQADESTPHLLLRAQFHSQFGYPERYLRSERVKQGAGPEVSWVVSKFESVAAE